MTTAEVLKAGRARIERGWCQYKYETLDYRGTPIAWCAAGALSRQDIPLSVSGPAYSALLNEVGRTGHFSVSGWNDTTGRTQAEVLALFDKAIALAEKETA